MVNILYKSFEINMVEKNINISSDNKPSRANAWVTLLVIEKTMLEILNPIVLILIDSIALVDKVDQRNLVER